MAAVICVAEDWKLRQSSNNNNRSDQHYQTIFHLNVCMLDGYSNGCQIQCNNSMRIPRSGRHCFWCRTYWLQNIRYYEGHFKLDVFLWSIITKRLLSPKEDDNCSLLRNRDNASGIVGAIPDCAYWSNESLLRRRVKAWIPIDHSLDSFSCGK